MEIILASKSPRRSEILQNLNIKFTVITAETDEASDTKDPEKLVEELALKKALAVKELLEGQNRFDTNTLIIGADTVVCKDGEILGKPKNKADAKRMLKALSNDSHRVISGISVITADKQISAHEVTTVCFDAITDDEIDEYISTGECDDKAGSYAIQGLASRFIKGINGCYFNVVGLPVNLLYKILKSIN